MSVDLSVVIPTLNEKLYLSECLNQLKERANDFSNVEVIVIDSGSVDGTLDDLPFSPTIYEHPEFIGKKFEALNQGAQYAKGESLLFLDADTYPPSSYDEEILKLFQNTSVIAGAFEFSFIEKSNMLRIIEICNHIRYRIRNSYYGDQGVFMRKSAWETVGGFPKVRLMETAKIFHLLRKKGTVSLLKSKSETSARRFIDGGVLSVFGFNIIVWIQNFLGINIQGYAEDYWKKNRV